MEREAGPALDADIGQHVMGLIVQRWRDGDVVTGSHYFGPDGRRMFETPAYSTTGDGMLLVIERMRALGWWWELDSPGQQDANGDTRDQAHLWRIDSEATVTMAGDTLPHAVALAALAALEGRDG